VILTILLRKAYSNEETMCCIATVIDTTLVRDYNT
jgi:hypothetical protein